MVFPTPSSRQRHHPPPFSTVVFDCDSTLSSIEGIEELAGDRREEIHQATEAAMDGRASVQSVYATRLELVRPDAAALAHLGRRYVETLVPGAREVAAALRFLGKRVCIVSGGLAGPVADVGRALGLDPTDVFGVEVHLNAEGEYAGFDRDSPMARSGGKLDVLRQLEAQAGAQGVAMVGDGITDLEAQPACARFIAYAGVVHRAAVVAEADAVCRELDQAALVPLLLSDRELESLSTRPEFAPLLSRARAQRS